MSQEEKKHKPGRKPDLRREHYAQKFNLNASQRKHLSVRIIKMLDACKSDEARRLLLFGLAK